MKIAVIPARGGSKRIPRKNVREFCGKPMLAWALEKAIESGLFDRVILTTDDEEIATIGRSFGAETPFMRPDELANDFATTGDVMKHAVEELGENRLYCCIYPTAPFVQAEDLAIAAKKMQTGSWDYVFSATHFAFPIQRALRQHADHSVSMFEPKNEHTRSQDLEPALHDAGQFYWGTGEA
ncbi:MAG: pseudaminic acid cytidylyltransferase, partial [Salaquimonas sp.]